MTRERCKHSRALSHCLVRVSFERVLVKTDQIESTFHLLDREIDGPRECGSCAASKFQCSGEIDAVEGVALAIGKVGARPC